MVRKVAKVETHHGKIGVIMTTLAAASAFGLFKNRRRRKGLMSKFVSVAATIAAAREVLKDRSSMHLRPSRLGAWLAR